MLQISNLSKSYSGKTLLEGASVDIGRNERVGLVGRNGSGKSTLFRMILGQEAPDEGTIAFPRGYRVGHLAQHLNFTKNTILEEACLGLPEEEQAMNLTYKGEIILNGLGFSESDFERAPEEFSGGFQIRINLAKVLLSEPDLLLLDEPTNYLDIVSSRWLSKTLSQWKGELVLITHDRGFMDSVVTHTMGIYRNGIRKMPGGTQKLYDQIALDEEIYEKTRLNEGKKRKEVEDFINRFRATASKAALVQSRIKSLERMGSKEELIQEDSLDFIFSYDKFLGKNILDVYDLSFGYTELEQLFSDLNFSVSRKDRIGIIGKNGRGKSTLLRALASELKPLQGEVLMSPNARLGFFGQTNVERLNTKHTIEEEIALAHPHLSRTRVRTIAGTMMFEGDSALKKIGVLSGGEKSRVLLGKIIASPTNILFLDEPTNHLDMDSIEALLESLKVYEGALILVTHNEVLLRQLCDRLIVFQGEKPFIFEGTYDYFLDKIGWDDELADESMSKKKIAVSC